MTAEVAPPPEYGRAEVTDMTLFVIASRVTYSYETAHDTVHATTDEEAFLAFYRMRISETWQKSAAYGQRKPRDLFRIVVDGAGSARHEPVALPDWVWARPDELPRDHPDHVRG